MTSTGSIRLLLLQPADLRRAALAAAFQGQRGIEVVAARSDETDLVAEVARLLVDVVVLDARLGRSRAVAVCEALRADGTARVLVVDGGDEKAFALAVMEAGTGGYVDHSTSLSELVAIVRRVHAGDLCIAPHLMQATVQQLIDGRPEPTTGKRQTRLSRRQREVAKLLSEGRTNIAIAEKLSISPHTARTHVRKVLEKLNAHSRIEAAAIALDLQSLEASHAV